MTSIRYFSGNGVAHRSVIFMALKVFNLLGFFTVILVVITYSVISSYHL